MSLPNSLSCFNSKVVRLKVSRKNAHRDGAGTFQFQSGAVKSNIVNPQPLGNTEFQFQSGAVKRMLAQKLRRMSAEFQFQSGAVKSK